MSQQALEVPPSDPTPQGQEVRKAQAEAPASRPLDEVPQAVELRAPKDKEHRVAAAFAEGPPDARPEINGV